MLGRSGIIGIASRLVGYSQYSPECQARTAPPEGTPTPGESAGKARPSSDDVAMRLGARPQESGVPDRAAEGQ
ncbi:hypothetical protein DI14_15180 [Exiguobacterium sp. AB2]|nr:hypothetical protein DI14_15180 [Exiguobacterium sp. AB2]